MKYIAVLWGACSVLTYGIYSADMRYNDACRWEILRLSYRDSMGIRVGVSVLGPMGLAAILVTTNFAQRGITYKNWAAGEKCEDMK